MPVELVILPLVGALIGWTTNLIAIKLIFYPREPIIVPLTGWKIHGLLPKRRVELARSIGSAIEKDLLPVEFLKEQVAEMELKKHVTEKLLVILQEKLEEKIPLFLPVSWRANLQKYIIEWAELELDKNLDEFIADFPEKFLANNSLGELVEQRIMGFPLDRLEKLVIKVASRELKHIEILGGVLGLVIGLFQALFLIYL